METLICRMLMLSGVLVGVLLASDQGERWRCNDLAGLVSPGWSAPLWLDYCLRRPFVRRGWDGRR